MRDFEKFNERFPGKDILCNSMTGKEICDEDYKYVLKVWNKFEMKNSEIIRICT